MLLKNGVTKYDSRTLYIRYQKEIKLSISFYFRMRIRMFQKGPESIRRIARSLRQMNKCSNNNKSRRNFTLTQVTLTALVELQDKKKKNENEKEVVKLHRM